MPREYHREYARKYYADNMQGFRERLGGKCAECKSKKSLQFDHKDPSTKIFAISCFQSYSKKAIEKELKKCQLLCGHCHAYKTTQANDNGQTKLSSKQVKEIRKLYASTGITQRELAFLYGVSQPHISSITLNVVRRSDG